MEVEKALDSLGSWGRWHVTHFVVLSTFLCAQSSMHMLAIVWIGHTPEHHCRLPEGASINDSIPRDSDGRLSQCFKYLNHSLSNQTVACDDGWLYDPHDSYTIVNKWDLVCEKEFYSQLPQTIIVLGVMPGAFLSSMISDQFGRKPVFMGGQLLMILVGVISAFVGNFKVFLVFRFITGILQQTILLSGFIMVSELFCERHRTMAGINVQCFWGFSAGFLAFLAFLIPNWAHLQLTISLLGLFCIPLFWFASESVPWLYANGRLAEAELIVRNAAKMNKVKLPEIIFEVKQGDGEIQKNMEKEEGKNQNAVTKIKRMFSSKRSHSHHYSTSYSLLDLFKSRKLLLYLVVCCFQWAVITLVYFGLSLTTGEMAGNRFLNGFYSGIVEVPAYIASYFLINRFGRRYPLIMFYLTSALSLILLAFLPKPTPGETDYSRIRNVLGITGKFGITGVFGIAFLYVAELFPTNLRNQALGISSLIGRVGNVLATFAKYTVKLYPTITFMGFGGLTLLAGLSTLLLPETKGRSLPSTIEEIEAWADIPRSQKNANQKIPTENEEDCMI